MKRLTTSVLVFGLVTSLALVTSCSDGLYEDDLDYNTSLASDTASEGTEAVHITINQVGNDQIDNQRVVEKSDDSIFSLLVADEHPVEISLENPLEKVKMIQMDICDEDDFLTLKRCETTDRTAGFLCRASESSNGCCSFLLFSLSVSGAIDQGTGPIVVLKYGASEDAPAGACRSLTTENVAATDVVNNPLEVISSQGEFCFAGDVFPCDDVIIDPDDEEVFPGTTIDFTASSASGNEYCEPDCYEWRIASTIGSTISSEGSYRAGSPGGVDEIMLLDACVDAPGDRLLATTGLLATAEVRVVVGDLDADDIPDDQDNCPEIDNGDQNDRDDDGRGDVCDNCPEMPNPGQENSDEDEVGDACDSCPAMDNPDQEDADRDGIGDLCDHCQDVDQDDVCGEEDLCPDSDPSATVLIGACDSGVENRELPDGCNMKDLIGECIGAEENHGSFVSCVAYHTNAWKKDGVITGRDKGAIQSCAARSDVP